MIPLDTRYRAVVHYRHFLPSLRRVAQLYKVSRSSLQRWTHLSPGNKRLKRRKRDIRASVFACIKTALERNPLQTISSLRLEIAKQCKLTPSIRTTGRWVARAGYTFKKAFTTVAVTPNPPTVLSFCSAVAKVPSSDVVWIDEAGFYVGDHASRGYAPVGRRLRCDASRTLRRVKLTLLMAITSTGVLHHEVLYDNCKKPDFVRFVNDLPVGPGTRVVMDNLQIHKCREVVDVMNKKKIVAVYTPPYSPRFNAIEYAFSAIKRLYRSECSELQAACGTSCLDREAYEELLHAAVMFPRDTSPFVHRTMQTVASAFRSPEDSSLRYDT